MSTDTSARARRNAIRDTVLDERLARAVNVERSLRQMVDARHGYAMVPVDLVGPVHLEIMVRRLAAAQVCGVVLREEPLGVSWVCLARLDGDDYAGHPHRWPFASTREQLARALAEQVDPIARIERRVAFALEGPSTHPLLADMPTA